MAIGYSCIEGAFQILTVSMVATTS